MTFKSQRGMGLVEVVIGASIITVGILALISSYNVYFSYALANAGNVQAAYLLEEGQEAMTILRDKGWTANILPLSTTTTYYIAFDTASSTWKATTTAQYIDTVFLRSIKIGDVQRSGTGAIVASGGTYDANTKLITATLNYFEGHATTTRSIISYISNLNSD